MSASMNNYQVYQLHRKSLITNYILNSIHIVLRTECTKIIRQRTLSINPV